MRNFLFVILFFKIIFIDVCHASVSSDNDGEKMVDSIRSIYFLDGKQVTYRVIIEAGQKGEIADGTGEAEPKRAIQRYGEKFRYGVWFINTKNYKDNSFHLIGKIDPKYNGNPIMLFTFQQDTILSVDTTFIKNGEFFFNGKEYLSDFSVVSTGNYPDKVISSEVILNKGIIHMELDSIKRVRGGELNDKLLVYQDSISILFENHKRISEDSIRIKSMKSIITYMYDFSVENKDNLLGINSFRKNIFAIAQIDSIRFEKLCDIFDKEKSSDEVKSYLNFKAKNAQRLQRVNKKYEDFEFQTPEGNSKKLSDYVGKSEYIYIDFWASWCSPCIAYMPHLKEIYKKYSDKGFEVIGISLDTNKKSWLKALNKIDVPWPQLCNFEGSQSKMAKAYFLTGVPYGILLNKAGEIIATNLDSNFLLEEKLQALFCKR